MTVTYHMSHLAPVSGGGTAGCLLVVSAVRLGVDAVRLDLTGELDLSSVPVLRAAVAEELAAGRREITADLRDVTFLDAAGIDTLVEAYRDSAAAGGRFRLTALSARQQRLLALAEVGHLFAAAD